MPTSDIKKGPLYVDSTNNRVGVGTTSPSAKLHLGGTAPLDSIIRQDSTVSGTNWEIGERAAGKWQIFEDDNDTVVATFQSSGNVGIGTSSPSSFYSGANNFVVGSGSGANGMSIFSGTTDAGRLYFADGTSGAARYAGYVEYGHSDNKMLFGTNGLTQAVIDSSGNLLVGTTAHQVSASSGSGGQFIGTAGSFVGFTRNGDTVQYNNRIGTDGTIIEFRKNGSTVGSIGSISGGIKVTADTYLGLGSADTGLRIASNEYILPYNPSTNSLRDAAIDLGVSSARWQNLFLSGGVYLGGTGSANLLDDVEEGSWTPFVQFGGSTTGITYALQYGWYQKVNKMVMITARLKLTSKGTATGNARISGLPFATALSNMNGYLNRPAFIRFTDGSNGPFWVGIKTDGNSHVDLLSSGDASAVTNGNFQNTTYLTFQLTYDTAN